MPSNTVAQLMIPELQREAEMTRKLLAKIPPDKLDFTPGHGLHTVGWNASHLAEIAGWVPGVINVSGMDMNEYDAEAAATATREATVPGLLEKFDANLAKSVASLDSATDAQMGEPWMMSMNGQEVFTMPKGEVLLKWVFTHTAHHRAVLSTLLRLAGVEHGSIYEE